MLMTLYLQVAVLVIATLSGLINGTTAAWSALAGVYAISCLLR